MLSTDGDLLFTGHPDGHFEAYDADTLKELWSFSLGTPITAPPMTYSVGGKQYVAVSPAARSACAAAVSTSPRPSWRCSGSDRSTTRPKPVMPGFGLPQTDVRHPATCVALQSFWPRLVVAGSGSRRRSLARAGDRKSGTSDSARRSPRCRSISSSIRPAAPMAGRPSRVLAGFAEFALCPLDTTTGLHEVWFRYDDELEYVARARRSEIMIRLYQANALGGQPIITSLLIDDAGLVQGYRIVNDPRAAGDTRIDAYGLVDMFKGMVGARSRLHRPAAGRRRAADRGLVRQADLRDQGRRPGDPDRGPPLLQARAIRGRTRTTTASTENEFESSARLEVFRPPAAAK